MYAKTFARCAGIVAFGLSSCSTSPDKGPADPAADSIPPPMISIAIPLEREIPRREPPPRACLLGSAGSCMDLDPRPFATCLVAGKRCEVKGARIVPLELEAPADPGGSVSR